MFLTFSHGQTLHKYYIYMNNSAFIPEFKDQGGYSTYIGNNQNLKDFFNKYEIISFDKAFPSTNWESFSKVLFLQTTSASLANDLIITYPSIYRKYDDLTDDKLELLNDYPDDYGNTNPNGNSGENIRRDDLDYINIEKAWHRTTGIGMTIGFSDAKINTTDIDFVDKVSFINPCACQLNPYNPNDQGQSRHGTATAGIAAAQGDNGHGSTGICYNCNIIGTGYGSYNNLLILAQSGVKVINMSWVNHSSKTPVGYEAEQMVIDSITKHYKTTLVAGAGNWSSYQTSSDHLCSNYFGTQWGLNYCFPASYKGVISVSSVNHRYPLTLPLVPDITISPNYLSPISPTGIQSFGEIQGSITDVCGNNPYVPIGIFYNGWSQSCSNAWSTGPNGLVTSHTTNPEVDILSPTFNTFRFDKFVEENGTIFYSGGGTSGATPRVSGTVALMLSINSCLVPSEVDNILKLTSKDIEQFSFNQIYHGQIGSGALDAGNAVEFAYQIKEVEGNALLNNHIFNRFNFNLQKINNILKIENVKFLDSSIAYFTARNQIHLLPGTQFSPNTIGMIHLRINPSIDISCIQSSPAKTSINKDKAKIFNSNIVLFPNPNNGSFDIVNIISEKFGSNIVQLEIFDLNGRNLYKKLLMENEFPNCHINLPTLSIGIYIVKLSSTNYSKEIKFIKK